MKREPSDAALYAARLARAFPILSTYSAASLAEDLCRIERAQRRHAERCCSGADGGYVRRVAAVLKGGPSHGTLVEHDPDAEARAGERIKRRVAVWRSRLLDLQAGGKALDPLTQRRLWSEHEVELEGDPRGPVLLLRLPGEAEPS